MSSPSPTLLVFSLGSGRERARRRLLPEAAAALEKRLHESCLANAVDAGARVGCEVVVSSPQPQQLPDGSGWLAQTGSGFGERFRGALAAVSASRQGDAPVVAVGADVPGLAAEHVRSSLAALGEHPDRVVVGPSPDGGFYLLAAARPIDRELAAVRWRSREALTSLLSALAASGRPVVLLEPLADLDRRRDLETWLAGGLRALPALFAGLVRSLLAALRQRPSADGWSPLELSPATVAAGRAPPA